MYDGLKTARYAVLGMLSLVALGVAPAARADTWDDTVKAAIAEGEVDVHGGPGELFHHILTDGFRQAFPQIKVNFSGLSGRDAIPKIVRERAGGIYTVDVYVGGSSSLLQSLKPIGAFAPIRPAFILPEVLDDKAWYGGLDGGCTAGRKRLRRRDVREGPAPALSHRRIAAARQSAAAGSTRGRGPGPGHRHGKVGRRIRFAHRRATSGISIRQWLG